MSGKRDHAERDVCCDLPSSPTDSTRCPASDTPGSKVDLVTLKALLTTDALRRLDGKSYRFCPSAGCDVVYFDAATGSVFREHDLAVRVWQKDPNDGAPVCYCFGYTVSDIRRDLALRGSTDIPAAISAEVQAGHCACEVRNPQGTCCLGNVRKAVKQLQSERRAKQWSDDSSSL